MLESLRHENLPLTGVVAEWHAADSVWRRLRSHPEFRQTYAVKQLVYRLRLPPPVPVPPAGDVARPLTTADFEAWHQINAASLVEEGLPVPADQRRRRADFEAWCEAGRWYGAWEDGALVATAALNASYQDIGQIGGLYTRCDRRRQGFARAVMGALIRESIRREGLSTLMLFTAEVNAGARVLYESLGFTTRGHFGLLFGQRSA
jgi:predicted GNAT family acetyltransferase